LGYSLQANNWKNSEQKPTANVDLWEQLLQFCSQHDVEFIRIKQFAATKSINAAIIFPDKQPINKNYQ
jgi:Ribonuclease HI